MKFGELVFLLACACFASSGALVVVDDQDASRRVVNDNKGAYLLSSACAAFSLASLPNSAVRLLPY